MSVRAANQFSPLFKEKTKWRLEDTIYIVFTLEDKIRIIGTTAVIIHAVNIDPSLHSDSPFALESENIGNKVSININFTSP